MNLRCHEPIENLHEDQILKYSKIPAEIDNKILEQSKLWAKEIAEELKYIGTLCVEFFIDNYHYHWSRSHATIQTRRPGCARSSSRWAASASRRACAASRRGSRAGTPVVIRPVHVHLKTDKVDLKKKPPRKNFFLHFFEINSSSRHEKRC